MKLLILLTLLSVFNQCRNKEKEKQRDLTQQEVQQPMIRVNKELIRQESEDIDAYVERHKLQVERTGTGLRYMIYKKGGGEKATTGKVAKINFTVKLLDGTLCYTSEKTGPQEFKIGEANVESGLHEGIQLMSVGDKAIIIIPSHRAHGLIGDSEKIPPLSPIVYDVELLELR